MTEGGHGLGPHVVGQRVVVRRRVPGETGPSGGPALTDVLGICESWAGGEAVIRLADGDTVVIPTALIVSGKPVPPRPSVRHRVGVREAESHAAPLWTGVVREPLGEWELRTEPSPDDRAGRGPRKRTNSALAIGDPGLPLDQAIDRVVAFYAERDRAALVQVEAGSDLDHAFADRGWIPAGGEALFLLGSTARALRAIGPATPTDLEVDGPRLTARTSGGQARAGVDGDWLGLHDLHVEPDQRRRGTARRLLSTLLDAGAERGATNCWLHVEVGNLPALLLYESLGFAEHHACRYLRAPG